jgi:superoxide dismutase, Cu-Zn family
MQLKNYCLLFSMFLMVSFSFGCEEREKEIFDETQQQHKMVEESEIVKAVAVLHPTQNNKTKGTIIFRKVSGGISVQGTIEGLTPGKHGFHIHEFGDCSAPDAASAGGHFNPTGADHGARTAEDRHVGDLGNIEADENGIAKISYVDEHLSFDGNRSIIGRGVIVHEKEDDLTTQPTGDAGGRLACGVIGAAKE